MTRLAHRLFQGHAQGIAPLEADGGRGLDHQYPTKRCEGPEYTQCHK